MQASMRGGRRAVKDSGSWLWMAVWRGVRWAARPARRLLNVDVGAEVELLLKWGLLVLGRVVVTGSVVLVVVMLVAMVPLAVLAVASPLAGFSGIASITGWRGI